MKQFFMILFLLGCLHYGSFAQVGKLKAEDVAKIKARQMIMVLREEDPEMIKKYDKSQQKLTEYRKEITAYNERIKAVAPQIWKFNSDVIFKPASEVLALQKSKNKEYAIAEFRLQKVKEKPALSSPKDPFKDELVVPTISIHLIEKPSAPIGINTFLSRTPSEGDLALALMQLQAAYKNIEGGQSQKDLQQQNAETQKTKILALELAKFKAGIPELTLKKLYPYPYEIADKFTVEQLILQQNAKYAVVRIAPVVDMPMLVHSVIDLETGNTLSSVIPGASGSGISAKDGTYITKESLAAYANGTGK